MKRIINVHEQFRFGHLFVVAGILLLSLIVLARLVTGNPPDYVAREALGGGAFFLCALACALSLHLSRRPSPYGFVSHGLPYISFPAAMLASGNDSNAMFLILAIALLANAGFIHANGKHDTYEEGSDLITIYFRPPF